MRQPAPRGLYTEARMRMARFFVLVVFLSPITVFGAVVPTPSITPVISASPSYQAPRTPVTLRAYANVPKGVVLYAWVVDGTEIARGLDIDRVTINTGGEGSAQSVTVTLTDTDTGVEGRALYIIRPASVDLLWEGNTYTPPFYRGKAYPTGGSSLVVEAVPYVFANGERVPKSNLVFNWEVDGNKLPESSGYGESVLRIAPTRFKYATAVAVTVTTPDGALGARTSVSVPTRTPLVVLYEDKPLSGTWFTKATPALTRLTGSEIAFKAVPFFVLNPKNLTYVWELNNEVFEVSESDPSVAVFRKTGGGEGQYPVSVTIEKPGSIFERASAGFDLAF